MIRTPLAPASVLAIGAICCTTVSIAQDEPANGFVELSEHVRIDRAAGVVEFDAFVPMVIDDPEQIVFLETTVCTRNSKEHETLLATDARPSNIHAALLLLGAEPGKPGDWEMGEDNEIVHIPPTGPSVVIEFVWTDAEGNQRTDDPVTWIVNDIDGAAFPDRDWVFAGSRIVEWTPPGKDAPVEVYDADYSGTLIGLATFGTETLAWPSVISHDSTVEEPVWIVDAGKAPAVDTPVVVRLRLADPD